jgi:hypothetical protein
MRWKTLVLIGLVVAARPARGEVERQIRAEIADAAKTPFVVENLVGRVHAVSGPGDQATVTATVHAASGSLADAVRIERTTGPGGAAVLHVRYPEGERTLRYRDRRHEERFDWNLFSTGEAHRYQGRTFHVSRGHGTLLYVDLEVRLPARVASARLVDLAGEVEAEGLEGGLEFDVESADLKLSRLRGDLVLHGTSGDIEASDIGGSWSSHFTSGDCRVRSFRGDTFSSEATSGDLEASGIEASRVRVRTTSGDVRLEDADVQELDAHATSGDVELDQRSSRLARAGVDASSGDVLLRLPADTSFRLEPSVSSGDVEIGFRDVTAEGPEHRDVAAVYRRGTGGSQIRVRTSSGNITLRPR